MPIAILIGFEYMFNSLTGAIVDLYHANVWCKSFNCDIHIFTDIENIKDPFNIKQVIERKIADSGLIDFCEYITTNNGNIVKNGTSLLNGIMRILERGIPDNKIIIYYSGHGVKDSMVMPDRSLLPFIDFRDNIVEIIDPYVEIFCILDCCNPSGMHLPYKLVNNEFILSPTKIECIRQPMLLITSSETNEKSIATKSGSVFSRHLFRLLTLLSTDDTKPFNFDKLSFKKKKIIIPKYKNRNLKRLIGALVSSIRSMHTGYSQTVSMYSSYINDPILWMWIGANKSYDLVVDITLSSLIIRNNESKEVTKSTNFQNKLEQTKEIYFNPYDMLYAS